MRCRVCNGVDADVAVENDVAVKFKSFASGYGSREYDIGVEGLLLLVKLVGYECSFAGNLLREGDRTETHGSDFPSSGEVRFEDFVVRLLWISYGTETSIQWVQTDLGGENCGGHISEEYGSRGFFKLDVFN